MQTPSPDKKAQAHAWLAQVESLAVSEADAAPPSASPGELPIRSRAAMRAALVDRFTVRDLESIASSPMELRSLLEHTNTVVVDRVSCLQLRQESRARILNAMSPGELIQELAGSVSPGRAAEPAAGSSVAWMRHFLRGGSGEEIGSDPTHMRAALESLEYLSGVKTPAPLPSAIELRRRLGLEEFLAPLKLLIGCRTDPNNHTVRDRFVGRKSELEALRVFVDELDAESLSESVTRGVNRLLRGVQALWSSEAAGVFMLEAAGGLGKSTLLAKFILDHARNPSRPIPTAYFDFDQSALYPRHPAQLLLEVARQLELQFATASSEFDKTQALARRLLSHTGQSEAKSLHTVAKALEAGLDAAVGSDRALLLVLDTMELVQSDESAMASLIAFLEIVQQRLGGRLRIVAAGRAAVEPFVEGSRSRRAGRVFKLNPLAHTDAHLLLQQLAKDFISDGTWKTSWTEAIVGADDGAVERREPLTLRVAAELIGREPESGRDALVESIRQEDGAPGRFVGALYRRRILGHIHHLGARKLAWPGLVLREVTPTLAMELLLPVCDLKPDEVRPAMKALAREVWVVSEDGDTLRHHPDLRARTLPFMREFLPEAGGVTFEEVNARAVEYFGARAAQSEKARAEWIYHTLLGGAHPEVVENVWSQGLEKYLRDAWRDLPHNPDGMAFLHSMTATRPIAPKRLASFPLKWTLEAVARTQPDLGDVGNGTLATVFLRPPFDRLQKADVPPHLENLWVSFAVKTGRWRELGDPNPAGYWKTQARVAYAHAATRDPTPGRLRSSVYQQEDASLASADRLQQAVNGLAQAQLHHLPSDRFDVALADALSAMRPSTGAWNLAENATLRLALVFGLQSQALAAALTTRSALSNQEQPNTYSMPELRVLIDDPLGAELKDQLNLLDRKRLDRLLANEHPVGRIADPQWCMVIASYVQRLGSSMMTREESMVIRRSAAERQLDWLVPLSHAAARCQPWKSDALPRLPDAVNRILAPHVERTIRTELQDPYSGAKQPVLRSAFNALRLAEECGLLEYVAEAFLPNEPSDDEAHMDLRYLLALLREWRERIGKYVGSPQRSPLKPTMSKVRSPVSKR